MHQDGELGQATGAASTELVQCLAEGHERLRIASGPS
jgi:hypothetical protein